jgi:Rad3-related DNA helicase
VIVLLDGRVGSMRYGETILDALPPARRVDELASLRGFL